ncbi:Bax inhibitor-1/YccA family protein [bacterium]|nr:Bax inhibitor-1/YccA family protein [bacterium]
MRLVYTWMGLGLLATAGMAWFTATTPALEGLRNSPVGVIGSLVIFFATVIALSVGMSRKWLTPGLAAGLFLVFSLSMGFSLSLTLEWFLANDAPALFSAFGTAAGLFGVMSIYGFTTRSDLSQWGTYLFMALIGLVIAMLINLFLGSGVLDFVISIVGVIIFTALTAYDTQKIKQMSMMPELQSDGSMALKFSIMGAVTLYLDFINLFLFLLSLFGGSRD